METAECAPGRLVDLFGDPTQPTILMWHGMQPDARAVMRPLAERVAGHGLSVVLPDWNSHAEDGGRADLLRAARLARERSEHPDALVLVGWSLGGVAAAGLTVYARRLGIRLAHTVCLAGAFMAPDPISGRELPTGMARSPNPSPFTLLHGLADDVVPVSASREFGSALQRSGWPVEFVELATDHAAIAGASYDSHGGRYRAADDAQTLAVAADVAARIAAVAGPDLNGFVGRRRDQSSSS